jgi:hypothetical protein
MAGDTTDVEWRYFPTQPSSLKAGDRVHVQVHERRVDGTVGRVLPNGAWILPTDEHGVRLLQRQEWCPDDYSTVEEINGESLF